RNPEEREKAQAAGADFDRVLGVDDLVRSDDVFFAATGITDGELLQGVKYHSNWAETESLVTRSRSGTVRRIQARHHWAYKQREGLGQNEPRKSGTFPPTQLGSRKEGGRHTEA